MKKHSPIEFRIPLVSIPVIALLLFGIVKNLSADEDFRIEDLANLSLKSKVIKKDNGDISTKRHTFCFEGVGITDVGNIRIAIRGLQFSGYSSGDLMLSSSNAGGGSGSTGAGNRKFTRKYKDGVTTCEWGGLYFSIKKGTLYIYDQKFDIVSTKPKIILIGLDRKIESVTNISETATPKNTDYLRKKFLESIKKQK
jgi:hypothetical protein